MKHTPGPWTTTGKWDEQGKGVAINHSKGWTLAHTHYLGGTASATANARLIAAAPDMYKLIDELANSLKPKSITDLYFQKKAQTILNEIKGETND